MKCKLTRPMEQPNPEYSKAARIAAKQANKPYRVKKFIWAEKGTEIENPEAWRLVRMGVAVPVDQECREAAGNLTEEEIARRSMQYEQKDRGLTTGRRKFDADGDNGPRVPAGMDPGTAGVAISQESESDEDE